MVKNMRKLAISTVLSLTVLTSFAMPKFLGGISSIAYAASTETLSDEPIEEGVYQIVSASCYKNLDVEVFGNNENGAQVQIYHTNGTSAQIWRIKKEKFGWYKIISLRSAENRCLDIENSNINNCSKIQIYDDNGSAAQRWKFLKNKDGSYIIVSKLSDNLKVLDVSLGKCEDRNKVWLHEYNGTVAQNWILVKVG
ncbi:RICIN domain-containing protein [Anaerosacchariphilus polymeriproducens]|uniref:Ricin B lectin domain-containing protein n=1 Tax=Anaerosacchariphilus polymeriproducens TaxID=1812858 RepID=A0A371AY45_9FIRM|nr:RICIN domain-containing protein [Anaerosacchariphilus polymeriproducens]RDU24504.1 hypothetical protein DWV06_03275 [Anaerosacchariphilus polymeriproducens]